MPATSLSGGALVCPCGRRGAELDGATDGRRAPGPAPGQIDPGLEPEQLAFELDALLALGSTAFLLTVALGRAQGPAELEARVQAADVSSMKTNELRQRRRLFLLALVGDLIGVAVVLTLGLDAWLVAVIAVGLLLPTLSMLAWMSARIRSAAAYSTEAERLGHHELVPGHHRRR